MGIHVCLMFVMCGSVIDYNMSCDRMMCHGVSWCVEYHVYLPNTSTARAFTTLPLGRPFWKLNPSSDNTMVMVCPSWSGRRWGLGIG